MTDYNLKRDSSGGNSPSGTATLNPNAKGSLIINSVTGDMKHPVQEVSFTKNSAGKYDVIKLKVPQGVLLDDEGNQIISYDPTRIMEEKQSQIIYLADMYIGKAQNSFALLGSRLQEALVNVENIGDAAMSFALSPSPYLNDPQRSQFISFAPNASSQAGATLAARRINENGEVGDEVGTYQLSFASPTDANQLKISFYNNDLQYEGKIAPVYLIARDQSSKVSFIRYQPHIVLPQYELQRKIIFSGTTTTPVLYTNLTSDQYQSLLERKGISTGASQVAARQLALPNGQPILELPIAKVSFIVNGQPTAAKVLKQQLIGGGTNTFTITQGSKINFAGAPGFSGLTSPIKLLVTTTNGDSHEVNFSVDVAKYTIDNTVYAQGQEGHSVIGVKAGRVVPGMKVAADQPAVFIAANKTTTVVEMTANGEPVGEAEIETDTGKISYRPEKDFVGTLDPQVVSIFRRNGQRSKLIYQPTIK